MSVNPANPKWWNKWAEIFDESVVQRELEKKWLFDAWKNLLKKVLPEEDNLSVLDIGTGTGFLAIVLAELGHSVTAIDVSSRMLNIAKKRAIQRGLNINFKLEDAMNLSDVYSEDFDVVISRYLTWCLPDLKKAYREWYHIIKNNGRLINIDGNWFRYRKSLTANIWRSLAWGLIYLTEKRKPGRHKKQELVSYKYPTARLTRPEDDIKILNSLGYRVIKVISDIYPFLYRGLQGKIEYIKRGYWGPAFMIVAEKRRNYCD